MIAVVARRVNQQLLCSVQVTFNGSFRNRNCSQLSSADSLLNIEQNTALISTSTDIYQNLALEDWIYSKSTFAPGACLLLVWRDTPCIVIGRHQNPWTEVNIRMCQKLGIQVARRNSGGGTVYHDLGNLNFSFMTNRQDYDRKQNLTFIREFLENHYSIQSEISPREDLVTKENKLKISGTASKMARINAYHHCTLLVNVDVSKMRNAIRKTSPAVIMSRATSSVRSDITNLSQLIDGMKADTVLQQVAELHSQNVYTVIPTERMFATLNSSSHKLSSWDWVFGKTPRFAVRVDYNDSVDPVTLKMQVNGGVIEEASVTTDVREISDLTLIGCKFVQQDVEGRLLDWSLAEDDHLLTCNVCKAADKLFELVT